ncbi:cationic amino acid transporter 3 [Neodiprion virginianus]|uniref:cationic amino acid transporter 3 n=1 Tax=Neodiprion virginianus TaxID=2961670 RepID=UPI001EE74FF9|nr:cationic amino acid transporter 3 [Neodiprion virginianus]XP_046620466.1 cationic amino acid transporter 3 [Neodiprion virginianus]
MAAKCWAALSRRRLDSQEDITADTALSRCLGLLDLTALGIGSTLGLGAYVLAGAVAKDTAGPAVCISFLIAAAASALAGLCYAEFASRVPKAGSAYVYSYVTVGEFVAFLIGWNLILEYVIGTASVARGFSNYLDYLVGNVMSKALREAMPINVSFLSEYPDFFAFGMVLLLAVLLATGVRESSWLNNAFTTINLLTLSVIIVAGSMNADPGNWFIAQEDIPSEYTETAGVGGFMPFGFNGVLAGAATCFYAFVGFDTIATTGEEAKNPQKNIPLAIVISLTVVFFAYFSISTVLTMMWPYYDQNAEAPFPYVFDQVGWPVIKWIVNVGAVFALCTSMLGAMFPLPRVLYAMATDGIIFKFLGIVNSKTQTPLYGTMVSGLLSGFMTLIFNINQLIDMMSIGTLMAYAIVALCVLILRYQPESSHSNVVDNYVLEPELTLWTGFKQIFNLNGLKEPTKFSGRVASWGIVVFGVLILPLGYTVDKNIANIQNGHVGIILAVSVMVLVEVLIVFAIGRQPVLDIELAFKVPLVPLIPCVSVAVNLYLMLQLDVYTWIRFAGWMFIGFVIYFTYGINTSVQGAKDKVERQELVQRNESQDKKLSEGAKF